MALWQKLTVIVISTAILISYLYDTSPPPVFMKVGHWKCSIIKLTISNSCRLNQWYFPPFSLQKLSRKCRSSCYKILSQRLTGKKTTRKLLLMIVHKLLLITSPSYRTNIQWYALCLKPHFLNLWNLHLTQCYNTDNKNLCTQLHLQFNAIIPLNDGLFVLYFIWLHIQTCPTWQSMRKLKIPTHARAALHTFSNSQHIKIMRDLGSMIES